MKKLIGLMALAVVLSFGMAAMTYAADQPMAAGSQTIQGDLLKIEGEFYVVKDAAGQEVRLHVDKTTRLEGALKAGDRIEAQATDKGHAVSIRPAK
jgi:hypothetical protein